MLPIRSVDGPDQALGLSYVVRDPRPCPRPTIHLVPVPGRQGADGLQGQDHHDRGPLRAGLPWRGVGQGPRQARYAPRQGG